MIIEKGKRHPVTRSDKPNENWTGDNIYFVVDDNSDLGKEILLHAPYYNEIKDKTGKLIEITPIERPKTP